MSQMRCIATARVTTGMGDKTRILAVGAFWQAGDTYEVTLTEAKELLRLFPESFEPADDATALLPPPDGEVG